MAHVPAAWRGDLIDIGGRRLRAVRAGPAFSKAPLVVLEHGAFGCASDWAVVQEKLAQKGLRSLAYDRAGLGGSDPGPLPRDGEAVRRDLTALLTALGETGPMLLVGHSMGGLMVRLIAQAQPDRTVGLVLVDAMVPELMATAYGPRFVAGFGRMLRLTRRIAKLGMMRLMAIAGGDAIGLGGEAGVEKRRIYGLASHAHWACEEVLSWPATSDMAGSRPIPEHLPVAAITAGAENLRPELKALQAAPALASPGGYVEHVAGANHSTLLGRRFGDPVVRGVEQVLAAAR